MSNTTTTNELESRVHLLSFVCDAASYVHRLPITATEYAERPTVAIYDGPQNNDIGLDTASLWLEAAWWRELCRNDGQSEEDAYEEWAEGTYIKGNLDYGGVTEYDLRRPSDVKDFLDRLGYDLVSGSSDYDPHRIIELARGYLQAVGVID